MTRTFIRQDTQIYSSDVFDDTVAPTLADFETNPLNVEQDLNNLRSMASHLLDVQVGNWYDVISTPSALETGTQRGVSNLNDALHAVEKKRVLRCVFSLVDVTVPAAVAATGTLTNATNFLDTETVTIDGKVYTFQTSLTNVDGNVQIGGTVALSHENLRRAINLDGVAGTNYATATTLHPTVSATDGATTTVVTAKAAGTAGNAITTAEATATGSWGGATLSGGSGGDVVVLGVGELPSNLIAAVGAVTTLGTVVAFHTGTFGQASLDEVAGPTAISPRNLLTIVDGSTRDPITSSGRQIYGLLQSEIVTDGHTINTTTQEVQITFVRLNSTGDDLEIIPGNDLGAAVINYRYVERVRLEDLNEADFLGGANIDVPSGSTVTRQVAYDNQGATTVTTAASATLDIGTGLFWELGDFTSAPLFRIDEDSGGGTTTVTLGAAVDTFDNNAVVNDFDAGATINSGGTRPIAVGVTDGVIESTAGDLRVNATAELFLDDVNQTGSTWAQTDGVKLSETTAEWDAYEVAFGGEVSLLNAIVQANNNNNRTKGQAVVTANVSADTDVANTTAGNLDVDLPDYSAVADFLNDVDVFLNGVLLRNGANAAANEDVYPGTTPSVGMLRFEFALKGTGSKPDVLTMIVYA